MSEDKEIYTLVINGDKKQSSDSKRDMIDLGIEHKTNNEGDSVVIKIGGSTKYFVVDYLECSED